MYIHQLTRFLENKKIHDHRIFLRNCVFVIFVNIEINTSIKQSKYVKNHRIGFQNIHLYINGQQISYKS